MLMKHAFTIFYLFVLTALPICAQFAESSEIQTINKKIIILYQEGKIDEAIEVSERAVKLAEKTNLLDFALMSADLGLLKKKRFEKILQLFLSVPEIITDTNLMIKKAKNDFDHAEKLFSGAIEVSKTQKINKDVSALWKSDLAGLFVSYEKAYFLPRKKAKSQLNEAVNLYTEAISDFDASANKNEDLILPAVFQLAELFIADAKFEEALQLYQRFVKSSKNTKNNFQRVISALRVMVSIFGMIYNQNEITETISEIASISGENEKVSPSDFNLFGRINTPQLNKAKILAKLQAHDYLYKRPYPKNSRRTDSISENLTDVNLARLVSVQVDILVDETGKVIEARGKSKDAKANQKAESEVTNQVFKPFIYNGTPKKMRGYVVYEYTRNN